MKKEAETALLRKNLDVILKKWRRVSPSVPSGGWIRNMREALDMTEDDLAQLMGVSASSISSLQGSEVKGTVALATLRRAAKAMHCSLVYALVPQRSLEKTLTTRRLLVAFHEYFAPSAAKTGATASPRDPLAVFAANIPRKRLWKELPKKKEADRPKSETPQKMKPLSEAERAQIVSEAQQVIRLSEALAKSEKRKDAPRGANEEDVGMLDKDVRERERNDLAAWKKNAEKNTGYVLKFRD